MVAHSRDPPRRPFSSQPPSTLKRVCPKGGVPSPPPAHQSLSRPFAPHSFYPKRADGWEGPGIIYSVTSVTNSSTLFGRRWLDPDSVNTRCPARVPPPLRRVRAAIAGLRDRGAEGAAPADGGGRRRYATPRRGSNHPTHQPAVWVEGPNIIENRPSANDPTSTGPKAYNCTGVLAPGGVVSRAKEFLCVFFWRAFIKRQVYPSLLCPCAVRLIRCPPAGGGVPRVRDGGRVSQFSGTRRFEDR